MSDHRSDCRSTAIDTDPSTELSVVFSRLPQPYHLHGPQLQTSLSGLHVGQQSGAAVRPLSGKDKSDDRTTSKSRNTTTSSESGTEADDESFAVARALPPAPLRPRKGLRDTKGTSLDGAVSPLLTPTKLDEDAQAADYFRSHGAHGADRTGPDEETKAARAKFIKRRRAELLRRVAETSTLAFLCLGVLRKHHVWAKLRHWKRVHDTLEQDETNMGNPPAEVLLVLVSAVVGLCLLYPVRLVAYAWKRTAPRLSIWRCMRVPTAFDPAPLLYPPFLPAMVSLSLTRLLPKALLPNIILGLASLPAPLIPASSREASYIVHWSLATLPLLISNQTGASIGKRVEDVRAVSNAIDSEDMILLFPLHQALVSLLQYLTTTSLLSAELQLLSIALINLLLFSSSPHAVILRTLLWMGGLGVHLSCGQVIRWGIALARIPRWRLRRATQTTHAGPKFSNFFERSRYGLHWTRNDSTIDSDTDDDQDRHRLRPSLRIDTLKAELLTSLGTNFFFADDPETKSAVEPSSTKPVLEMPVNGYMSKRRRYTMTNFEDSVQYRQKPKPKRRRKSLGGSLSQSFLNLTPTQATIRKWLYAGYVYLAMLVLVLGPIRIVTQRYALDMSEPFGWAIGYLFGGIPQVRSWVHLFKLEPWIPLPSRSNSQRSVGRAEYLRRTVVGESNTRLLVSGHCITVLALGMATVLRLSTLVEVDTRRKVFHGMMVAILVPSIYIDPAFIALALGLVLAGFLILDLLRASQLPPLSKPLAYFLTPYVDGRDLRGPVVVSHIFLLIGCAVPLWLSLADAVPAGERPWRGWEVGERDVSMVSGVVCVGMGDAAASLIGRRYGRRKWPWAGGKSLEGSTAFALAVTAGMSIGKFWLWLGQWDDRHFVDLDRPTGTLETLGKASVAACLASLMEAVLTGGNDNVIVPILLWLVVRVLDM